MAEKEYIEREALPGANMNDNDYADGWNDCLLTIDEIPAAADVRPVVLCAECIYYQHDEHGNWCFNNYETALTDDDFCSHGKKKGA